MPTANAHKALPSPGAYGHPARAKACPALSQVRSRLNRCITSVHPTDTLNKRHDSPLPQARRLASSVPRARGLRKPPNSEITNLTSVTRHRFVAPPPGSPSTRTARLRGLAGARSVGWPDALRVFPRACGSLCACVPSERERPRRMLARSGVFIPAAPLAKAETFLPTDTAPLATVSCFRTHPGKTCLGHRSQPSNPHVTFGGMNSPAFGLRIIPRPSQRPRSVRYVPRRARSAKGQAPNQQTRRRVWLVRQKKQSDLWTRRPGSRQHRTNVARGGQPTVGGFARLGRF